MLSPKVVVPSAPATSASLSPHEKPLEPQLLLPAAPFSVTTNVPAPVHGHALVKLASDAAPTTMLR